MGAAPDHTSEFYVNDYADILTPEAENKILAIGNDLCDDTSAQVVVLTVESLGGEDISEFAVETFRKWGIGDEDKDNGVLIVFSLNDREMWITVGYGLEGTLTDTRAGQIRDTYAMPYYKNNEFEKGTIELYCAIVNYIRTEEYGLDPLTGYEEMDMEMEMEMGDDEYPPFEALLVLLVPFIAIGGAMIHHKRKYARLLAYDRQNGTHFAEEYKKQTADIGRILLYMFFFNGGGRGGRGGHGGGGFGGGGGFRGGGGSTGGGGAGGKF